MKRFVGSLAAAIGLAVVVSQPAHALPSTLFVNATGGADTGMCPSTAPCATISYALTQAAVGATIFVANGIYPEQVTMTSACTALPSVK